MKWTFSENLEMCILMMLKLWIIHLRFDKVLTKCLHHTAFAFFPFQRWLVCFVPEFLFCNYLLNFFLILCKMQVIVEMSLYDFMFASLN